MFCSAEFLSGDIITRLRWMRVLGDTIFAAGTVALVVFILGLTRGSSYREDPKRTLHMEPAGHTA